MAIGEFARTGSISERDSFKLKPVEFYEALLRQSNIFYKMHWYSTNRATVGTIVKNPPKIRIKKSLKLTDHTYASNYFDKF